MADLDEAPPLRLHSIFDIYDTASPSLKPLWCPVDIRATSLWKRTILRSFIGESEWPIVWQWYMSWVRNLSEEGLAGNWGYYRSIPLLVYMAFKMAELNHALYGIVVGMADHFFSLSHFNSRWYDQDISCHECEAAVQICDAYTSWLISSKMLMKASFGTLSSITLWIRWIVMTVIVRLVASVLQISSHWSVLKDENVTYSEAHAAMNVLIKLPCGCPRTERMISRVVLSSQNGCSLCFDCS